MVVKQATVEGLEYVWAADGMFGQARNKGFVAVQDQSRKVQDEFAPAFQKLRELSHVFFRRKLSHGSQYCFEAQAESKLGAHWMAIEQGELFSKVAFHLRDLAVVIVPQLVHAEIDEFFQQNPPGVAQQQDTIFDFLTAFRSLETRGIQPA